MTKGAADTQFVTSFSDFFDARQKKSAPQPSYPSESIPIPVKGNLKR
jgi:hypothetical protein